MVRPVPAAFITSNPREEQPEDGSQTTLATTMLEPSGFQAGKASCPGSLVSRVNPVPFALMTQISLLPLSTTQVNASRVPTGDQAGLDTAWGVSVSRVGTPAFMTYTPLRPLRELMNAIFVPSGDHVGCASEASFVRSTRPEPSAFITANPTA